MRIQLNHVALPVALSTLILSPLRAEEFTIDWAVTTSGSQTSLGGTFELAGTIGQPFIGDVEAGNLFLESGFWFIIAESRGPAPNLYISTSDARVIIEWNPSITGYLLEEVSNLSSPLTWREVLGVTQNRVTLNPAETLKIFRLRRLQ
jgi:hypothetical protein